MLDAARRKVDQQNHEAHQLRHDKREIGVRLQGKTTKQGGASVLLVSFLTAIKAGVVVILSRLLPSSG